MAAIKVDQAQRTSQTKREPCSRTETVQRSGAAERRFQKFVSETFSRLSHYPRQVHVDIAHALRNAFLPPSVGKIFIFYGF